MKTFLERKMNATLQAREAKRIFPVPDGLRELCSDITREALRHQPNNLYSFMSDYLDTVVQVREATRDAATVISCVYTCGQYLDDLRRRKGITRSEAHRNAIIIEAAWRGYLARRDLVKEYNKCQHVKQVKRELHHEEFLDELGVTEGEAERAADIIQSAYRRGKDGRDGKCEYKKMPFGQLVREADKARGMYARCSNIDFGEFLPLDQFGDVKYIWPRVGQLRKVPRDAVVRGMRVVQFHVVLEPRSVNYTYMLTPQPDQHLRGIPVGFLVPDSLIAENTNKFYVSMEFVKKTNPASAVYKILTNLKTDLLENMYESLTTTCVEGSAKNLPRAVVKIDRSDLKQSDEEVRFVKPGEISRQSGLEPGQYAYYTENIDVTKGMIEFLVRNKTACVEDAVKTMERCEVGRLIPVGKTECSSKHLQKIRIIPETSSGEVENDDLDKYEYVFLARDETEAVLETQGADVIEIPVARFQGYRRGCEEVNGSRKEVLYVMGPMLTASGCQPFTSKSPLWDDFGEIAWYRVQTTCGESASEMDVSEIVLRTAECKKEGIEENTNEKGKSVSAEEGRDKWSVAVEEERDEWSVAAEEERDEWRKMGQGDDESAEK